MPKLSYHISNLVVIFNFILPGVTFFGVSMRYVSLALAAFYLAGNILTRGDLHLKFKFKLENLFLFLLLILGIWLSISSLINSYNSVSFPSSTFIISYFLASLLIFTYISYFGNNYYWAQTQYFLTLVFFINFFFMLGQFLDFEAFTLLHNLMHDSNDTPDHFLSGIFANSIYNGYFNIFFLIVFLNRYSDLNAIKKSLLIFISVALAIMLNSRTFMALVFLILLYYFFSFFTFRKIVSFFTFLLFLIVFLSYTYEYIMLFNLRLFNFLDLQRSFLFISAFDTLEFYPFFGVGREQFDFDFGLQPHNMIALLIVQGGYPGLILGSIIYIVLIYLIFKASKRNIYLGYHKLIPLLFFFLFIIYPATHNPSLTSFYPLFSLFLSFFIFLYNQNILYSKS